MGSKALVESGKFSPFLYLFYKIKLIHVKIIYVRSSIKLTVRIGHVWALNSYKL